MNIQSNKLMTRRGFTLIELMMVISIMAVIATLATGAAVKSIKQSRSRRVDATIKVLEMALMNYRAQENEWPFTLGDLQHVFPKDGTGDYYSAEGEKNAVVFTKLLASKSPVYLDGSALLTAVKGRMTVKKAIENGAGFSIPIGYPDPDSPATFKYFTVKYFTSTDRVTVSKP